MKATLFSLVVIILSLQMQAQPKKSKSITNAKFIIGTWELIQAPNGGGISIAQTWEFNGTDFKMYGYPQIQQQGRYTIKKDSSNTLILNLYGQTGDLAEDETLTLLFNRKTGSLSMNSMNFKKK